MYKPGITGLSQTWFSIVWQAPATGLSFLQHLLLIDDFPANNFDPVVWSLIQEMRMSLIFPVLVWIVRRYPVRVLAPAGLALVFVGSWVSTTRPQPPTGYLTTLAYIPVFCIGIWLAQNWQRLLQRKSLWSRRKTAWVAFGAVLCYGFPYVIAPLNLNYAFWYAIQLCLTSIASVVFILLATGASVSTWLRSAPL